MKKYLIICTLGLAAVQTIHAQARQAAASRTQQTGSATFNNQARIAAIGRMTPIPKRINLMQYRKNLPSFAAHPVNNTAFTPIHKGAGVASGTRDRMNSSPPLLLLQNYTIGKSFADGSRSRFTLTQNVSSWENRPVYSYAQKKAMNTGSSDPGWNCVSTTQTFNAQSTSFMNANPNEKGSHLVAGAIYSFDDYSSGNFREYANDRNPVTVYTTTTVGNNSATIPNPNGQTLSQGVSGIAGQFAPDQGGATQIIQTTSVDNLADYSIQISAGGSYGAFSGSASFTHSESEHHLYFTVSAIKPMYTISVQRPANGYFAEGKTPSTNSPLVVIQDVTYGARILANLDLTVSSKTNLGSLGINYNDGVESASLNFNAIANDKTVKYTINTYMVGVPVHAPMTTLQDFMAQISSIFAQADYHSAAPVQYALTDLDGNALGIESATDAFTTRTCTPADETFVLQSVMASIGSGEDGKNGNSEFWLELYNGTPANHTKFAVYYDNNTEFNNKYTPTVNVPFLTNSKPLTLTDFKDGGAILLRLSEHGHSRDDWDINSLKLTFNFMSQKGTPQPKIFSISNFRFSDKSNPVFYFNGDFQLVQ